MEAIDTSMELAETRRESVSWLTVERLGYIAVGLLAAALRFAQLGLRPLNAAEAVQALAALRFAGGAIETAPPGTIPGLFTGNIVAFTLLGSGDVVARWLPALAGVILVLLPYGLRHRLGRGGALAASFLLAVSPSAVFFSRDLDGAMVVAASGLAITVGLINLVDTQRPAYLYLAAGALGLGLTIGSGIYTILAILAAFALLLYLQTRLRKQDNGWSSVSAAWSALKDRKGTLAKTGVVLVATFGLVAMTFVLHPAGVGYAADLLGEWARSFLPESGGQPLIYPLLLLLRYEPLVLVLGLVEIGRWLASKRWQQLETVEPEFSLPLTALLVFWALVAFLVILISGHRPAGNILLVVVPLALLAGQGIERAWLWIPWSRIWREASLLALTALGVSIFLYLQIAAYVRSSSAATVSFAGITMHAGATYLILAGVGLLLLVVLGVGAWIWRGRSLLLGGGWLAALALLGLWCFQAMWGLNFAHASDPRELMIMQTTAPDVHRFVDRLGALSLDKSGDATTLPITVDAATGPVVAWYLRGFGQQFVVEDLFTQPGTIAAVSLPAQDLPIGETFRGQGFPLRTHWLPWGLDGKTLIRWLLFEETSQPVVDQELVLWVISEPQSMAPNDF
jgi:uncharacterized protein (TIGR03663 family)